VLFVGPIRRLARFGLDPSNAQAAIGLPGDNRADSVTRHEICGCWTVYDQLHRVFGWISDELVFILHVGADLLLLLPGGGGVRWKGWKSPP